MTIAEDSFNNNTISGVVALGAGCKLFLIHLPLSDISCLYHALCL